MGSNSSENTNKGFIEEFSSFLQVMAEANKKLLPLVVEMQKKMNIYGPALIRTAERVAEFTERLHQVHAKDMLFVPPFLDNFDLQEINELLVSSDKPAIEVYHEMFLEKKNLEKLLGNWSANSFFNADRMVILKDALDAHYEKKFTLSIPVLVGQLEGLILEAFEIGQKQIVGTVQKVFPSGKDEEYLSHLSGSYMMQKILVSEVFNSKREKKYASKEIYPNRPSIQHGVNSSYFKNPYFSTRLIMLIDFMGSEEFQKSIKSHKTKKRDTN